jgi:signal transduction histidine kinase
MRKSVLMRRIILLLLCAILLSGLLSMGIYIFVTRRMYLNMKSEELISIARTVAEIIASEQENNRGGRGVWPLLDRENRNFLGASLHIYNADGESIMNPAGRRPDGQYMPPQPDESPLSQMLRIDLADALSGKETSAVRKSSDGVSFLLVGVPINSGGTVSGAVIFTKPVSELADTQNALNLTLLVSTLAAFVVMLVPGYFFAKKLIAPIRQMREVTHAMAGNDFSKRADETQKSELGDLGRALNRLAKESGRLEQTRRDYVANVSHELRTPVSAIRAMGETLRDGMAKTSEKQNLFYNNIVRESLRLSRLIDDLLELSRLQSGAVTIQKIHFDLQESIRNAADMYGQMAAAAGARLSFPQQEKPVDVYGSPDRVEQTLVILLDNAIKHTPEDGEIALTVLEKDHCAEVCVANTGPEIAAEDLPYIFDRFYKSDESHSGDGFGLGLSIAKEIMNRLGESIRADSENGITRFAFTVSKSDITETSPAAL